MEECVIVWAAYNYGTQYDILMLNPQVYQPLNTILNSWIFDGELIDRYSEFIVSCDFSSKPEKLWRSKYTLRKLMVPSFIPHEVAQKVKILATFVVPHK